MIYILDENLQIVDILRKYNFAQYNNKFRDIGAFKINAQLVDENIYILDETKQYYVLFDFDEYIFGQVTKVKQSGEGDNDKEIVIEGKLSKYILTKRVINGTINYKGKTFGLVKEMIDSNIVSSSNAKRNLPIEINCDEEYLTSVCSDVTKQITGGYVWEEVEKLLTQDNLGIDFVPNIITDSNTTNIDKWYLTINAGVDRTKENKYGNNPVIFSQQLSNIASVDYERDVEEYTNYAYVAGEGEEENRKWYEVNRTDKDASGWNRKELWIDARDIQSENKDGTILSETEYEKLIKERANEKFSESDVQESYEATLTEKNAQYTYGIDYNLGDWCTITDINLNKELDVQITEITVTIQGTRKIVDVGFTYGLIKKDPIKQTQQNTININKTENNVRYLENITKPFTKAFSFLKDATGKIIGIAIGKIAELEGVLDIAFKTRHSGGLYYDLLPTGTDLNDLTTPNTYILKYTHSYTNAPTSGIDATLEVTGRYNGVSGNIEQKVSVHSEAPRNYIRHRFGSTWTAWTEQGIYPATPARQLETYSDFPTFWQAVESVAKRNGSCSCFVRCKIESGCFSNGFTGWCRMWCSFQNVINASYNVTGSIILLDGSNVIRYAKVTGGKGDASTLVDTWQTFVSSDNIANNFTTTSAGYVADARTVAKLSNRFSQPAWATSHAFTIKSGYYYLFVGLDCTYSAYAYSSGAVNVHQISKASSSKVTYTVSTNKVTFSTTDGGTCTFMVITNAM